MDAFEERELDITITIQPIDAWTIISLIDQRLRDARETVDHWAALMTCYDGHNVLNHREMLDAAEREHGRLEELKHTISSAHKKARANYSSVKVNDAILARRDAAIKERLKEQPVSLGDGVFGETDGR